MINSFLIYKRAGIILGLTISLCLSISDSSYAEQQRLPNCSGDLLKDNCFGIHIFDEDTAYEGEWKNGKKEGFGELITKDYTYNGHFKNDEFNGFGQITSPSATLLGFFVNGNIRGEVNVIFNSGEEYFGYYNGGHREGFGRNQFKDKSYYVGNFKNNKQEGEGIRYDTKSSKVSSGRWKNDVLINDSDVDITFVQNIASCWAVLNTDNRSKVDFCTSVIDKIRSDKESNTEGAKTFNFNNKIYSSKEILEYSLYHRSRALQKTGDFENEILDLQALLGIKKETSYYIRLASAQLALNMCGDSIASLNRAIDANPDSDDIKSYAYLHRASAYLICGDNKFALSDMNKSTWAVYTDVWKSIFFNDQTNLKKNNYDKYDWLDSLQQIAYFAKSITRDEFSEILNRRYDRINLWDSLETDQAQVQCEGNFYLGLSFFLNDRLKSAQSLFLEASKFCPPNFLETSLLNFYKKQLDERLTNIYSNNSSIEIEKNPF